MPHRKDATGHMEKVMESVLSEMMGLVEDVAPRHVINRPLGSVPVTKEQRAADYQAFRANPMLVQDKIQELVKQGRSLEEAQMELGTFIIEEAQKEQG